MKHKALKILIACALTLWATQYPPINTEAQSTHTQRNEYKEKFEHNVAALDSSINLTSVLSEDIDNRYNTLQSQKKN